MTSQIITNSVDFPQYLSAFQNISLGTSSVVVDTAEEAFDNNSAFQSVEDYQQFSTESLTVSSSSTVMRPDEAYEINRIMSRINTSKVEDARIKEKLECFFNTFKQFLLGIPSYLRKHLPLLSMKQDADGDYVIIWATQKANAIFNIATSWKDSFWCATSNSRGEEKSESAALSENTIFDGILKSFRILFPYV